MTLSLRGLIAHLSLAVIIEFNIFCFSPQSYNVYRRPLVVEQHDSGDATDDDADDEKGMENCKLTDFLRPPAIKNGWLLKVEIVVKLLKLVQLFNNSSSEWEILRLNLGNNAVSEGFGFNNELVVSLFRFGDKCDDPTTFWNKTKMSKKMVEKLTKPYVKRYRR